MNSEEELYHYGVLGMRWGHRKAKSSLHVKSKKKRRSYEDRVRSDMEKYNKSHPERSAKDNYTVYLRNEGRRQDEKGTKMQILSMMTLPLAGAGLFISVGSTYVQQKRHNTLSKISDEYNIETAKRVLNF